MDILEARETSRYESEDKFKQSALTFSVSSPLLSAVEAGQQMADAASNTSDGRMQALAGAAAAFKGYNTYKGMIDAAGNHDCKFTVSEGLIFRINNSKYDESAENIKTFLVHLSELSPMRFVLSFQGESVYAIRDEKRGFEWLWDAPR